MMETRVKFANYYKFCKLCKHKDEEETDEPCNECLTLPVNVDTRKPICFEEAK